MQKAASQRSPSFRIFVQDELLKRCKRHPGYSLRAFAKSLQVSHSTLSRYLKGERVLSERLRTRLALRLGADPSKLADWTDEAPAAQAGDFNQLSLDCFAMISDWYHFAVLELTAIESFQSDCRSIAKALGITVSEANAATARLLRLGFLRVSADGRWVNASGNNTNISDDMRHEAKRRYQRQVLELAIKALDEVPLDRRNQTSLTVAMSATRLPEVVRRIAAFRRSLCRFLESDTARDQVYQLSISFFPLTQTSNTNKEVVQ